MGTWEIGEIDNSPMGQKTPRAGAFTQIKWAKGADVASAAALTLGTDGNYFDVTGTVAITSIKTLAAGTFVGLHFDGILVLTHHATNLILPGGANITTAAGDEALFEEYAAGTWRCVNYSPASVTGTGSAVRATSPTFVTPALGTPASGVMTNVTGLLTAGLVNDAVTYAKMQNVSATDKVLGRVTAGAGDVEEIACTAAGRALIDDANAATQLGTLGLTAIAAELNILDGALLTVAELNYVDGVTSAIQTQINTKAPLASPTFTGVVIAPSISIGYLNQNISCLTYDDSTLSGIPIIIRLQDYAGTYYYAKMYLTASATANATIDDIGLNVIGITDATLSGTPKVFEIKSNVGTSYYVKAYPTISAEIISSRGITLTPIVHVDAILSGTPRVASVQIGGVDYYAKTYPTKA